MCVGWGCPVQDIFKIKTLFCRTCTLYCATKFAAHYIMLISGRFKLHTKRGRDNFECVWVGLPRTRFVYLKIKILLWGNFRV
jgi:hypothetical protein